VEEEQDGRGIRLAGASEPESSLGDMAGIRERERGGAGGIRRLVKLAASPFK